MKVFKCKKCYEPVIWNHEYFKAKDQGIDLSDLTATLNIDGSQHACFEKKNPNFKIVWKENLPWIQKFYQIVPGQQTHDFARLDLELGTSMNGFLTQAGSLLMPNNEKIFPLTWEKYMDGEMRTLQKNLARITLDEFIDIYYPPQISRHHVIRDARTKQKLPLKTVVMLLLKRRGVDVIGSEKYLVWSESKFEKFFTQKQEETT